MVLSSARQKKSGVANLQKIMYFRNKCIQKQIRLGGFGGFLAVLGRLGFFGGVGVCLFVGFLVGSFRSF